MTYNEVRYDHMWGKNCTKLCKAQIKCKQMGL